jgi:cobalt/nickel transport system permease protein
MHIPDGYLSPQTSITAFGAMIPFWSLTLNKLKKVIGLKQIPLLSLCAAFSFVIMMFNIPIGPSSVHAVGAVFIAILMGPWAAVLAISAALVIQAFIFGDGGILALGANCFNMALAMPFVGYFVYKIIAGKSEIGSKRNLIGAFFGSYAGLNIAALFVAIEIGIQPILFKTAEGLPKYGFVPLSISLPTLLFENLAIAGVIEAIITVSAISYLYKLSPQLFDKHLSIEKSQHKQYFFKDYKAFIVGIIVLIIITPVGSLASGTAWGEWGVDKVKNMIHYVPEGLAKLSGIWNALIPNYSMPGLGKGFFQSSLGYIASAAVGVLLIVALMLLSSKLITKKEN